MPAYEHETPFDKSRVLAVLSYMTIFGWLIALVLYGKDKNPYVRFHLRQSLGLFVSAMLLTFVPLIGWLLVCVLIVAWCYGLYSAFTGHKFSIPMIGDFYQSQLYFIN